MPWLRIDDTFADHPKLVTLGDTKARWTFLELMLYCARHKTEGFFPENIGDIHRRITPRFVAKCVRVGLVDQHETELRIHDWERYNPPKDATSATRQARWRNTNRNTNRNTTVTPDVTDEVTPSRVGARACPVPSLVLDQAAALTNSTTAAADLNEALDRINVTGGLRTAAHVEPDRALACALAAEARATSNPAGLFRTMLESGEWPVVPAVRSRPNSQVSSVATVERMIRNGAIMDAVSLEAELAAVPKVSAEDRERLAALLPEVAA